MKAQSNVVNGKANAIRWQHEEHEGIVLQADKLNHGDISGWAKATTRFRRPCDVQLDKRKSFPVNSLANVHPVSAVNLPAFGERRMDSMPPGDFAPDNRANADKCFGLVELGNMFARFYASKPGRVRDYGVVE